ncbi:hypothetical protein [Scytonema sp. HK-05]
MLQRKDSRARYTHLLLTRLSRTGQWGVGVRSPPALGFAQSHSKIYAGR